MNARQYFLLSMTVALIVTHFTAFAGNNQIRAEGKKYPAFFHRDFLVDGRLTDWPSGLFYNNSEANVLYAVANDSARLYFCIQILEQSAQLNTLHDGLVIGITVYGKKREFCQIHFPYEAVIPNENNAKTGNRRPRSFTASLKLDGFNENINGIFPPDSLLNGIETAIAYDSTGALVIEMAISLSGFKSNLRTAKYAVFGFVINGKGKSAKSGEPDKKGEEGGGKQSGSRGGSGSGGMGGKHGGGGGSSKGSGSGHSQGGQNRQTENNQFKISHKFAIASLL